MSANSQSVFLTAEWRHLAMVNYEIDPVVLAPLVPAGTELDFWQGRAMVSMVGFLFLNTRLRGVAIPFHQDFEEVNLRFYVRRKTRDEWRRGVVFVKEIVPRFAIAFIARVLYNENYVALPMSHEIELGADGSSDVNGACYSWDFNGRRNKLALKCGGFRDMSVGSEEEFITEHYWGYARQRNGGTKEYRVEHPRWRVASAQTVELNCDAAELYGYHFSDALKAKPASAFLAEGSEVKVYHGVRLEA